jgi:hypothetical protein
LRFIESSDCNTAFKYPFVINKKTRLAAVESDPAGANLFLNPYGLLFEGGGSLVVTCQFEARRMSFRAV